MTIKNLEQYRKLFPLQNRELLEDMVKVAHESFFEMLNGGPILRSVSANSQNIFGAKTNSATDLSWMKGFLKELLEDQAIQEPGYFANAIPVPSIPSLIGNYLSKLTNSNPIWDHYGPFAVKAEIKSARIINDVMNYGDKSGAYFTGGGSAGNRAGLRIGLEKAARSLSSKDNDKKFKQLNPFLQKRIKKFDNYSRLKNGNLDNMLVFSSDISHFSVNEACSSTGIGEDHNISIKSNYDNSMNLMDLEMQLDEAVRSGCLIGAIFATPGTTDSFGIDDIKGIYDIRNNLVKEHNLNYIPHIHADAAMGGLYTFFNNYDFRNNPLEFDKKTLNDLALMNSKIKNINLADSISNDIHKLGMGPYLSTLFSVKNIDDFQLVNRDEKNSPYIKEAKTYGTYHTSWTEECSRDAAGVGTLLNLKMFKEEGYQVMLGHYVEKANLLKKELSKLEHIEVLNDNPGPVVNFRYYPNAKTSKQDSLDEIAGRKTANEVKYINMLNDKLAKYFGENRDKFFLGSTSRYRTCGVDNTPISAIKGFVISPYTTEQTIIDVVKYISETIDKVIK